jgi:peroxin-2
MVGFVFTLTGAEECADAVVDATYGAALQNLKFTDARKKGPILVSPSKLQKALYGLLTVGGSYAWSRWEQRISDSESSYDAPTPLMGRLSSLTSKLSTVYSTAALASFLVFLVNGRYRTLLDRLLRLRLAPPTSQVSREVSFEYLNRQLVWHAFTEFLLFLLPLVGISRWRRWLSRAWRKTKSLVTSPDSGDAADAKAGELAYLPERTCAICYQDQNAAKTEAEIIAAGAASGGVVGSAMTDITNPYEADCAGACVYCFVCLAGRLEAEGGEGWTCLRCGEVVKECRPWSGDVIEEPARGKGAKTVGFSDEMTGDVVIEPVERAFSESTVEDEEEDGEVSGSDAYEEDEDMEEMPDFDE